jgi:transposase
VSRYRRQHSREFKLAALARFERTSDVQGLARELGIDRGLLYKWQAKYEVGGAEALATCGRPRGWPELGSEGAAESAAGSAAGRIAELERKVGQQELALDFFRAALRHVRDQRRRSGGPGGSASTR